MFQALKDFFRRTGNLLKNGRTTLHNLSYSAEDITSGIVVCQLANGQVVSSRFKESYIRDPQWAKLLCIAYKDWVLPVDDKEEGE